MSDAPLLYTIMMYTCIFKNIKLVVASIQFLVLVFCFVCLFSPYYMEAAAVFMIAIVWMLN